MTAEEARNRPTMKTERKRQDVLKIERWDDEYSYGTNSIDSSTQRRPTLPTKHMNQNTSTRSMASKSSNDSAPIRPVRRSSINKTVIPFSRSSSRRSLVLDNSWHGHLSYNWNEIEATKGLSQSGHRSRRDCLDNRNNQSKSIVSSDDDNDSLIQSNIFFKQDEVDRFGDSAITLDALAWGSDHSTSMQIDVEEESEDEESERGNGCFQSSYFSFF